MTKNYIFTALIVLCLGAGNTGCSNKSDVIVAHVGKEKITLKEFNKSLDDATQVYGDYLNSESGKKQLLDSIIKEKLVLDAAKKAGIKNRPEIKKKLALLNEKIAETQKKYESEILIEEILKEKSSLKPNEIKEYFDKNRDEFEKPIEIRVSHILLNTKDEASRIYERIKKGENFAQLARDFSIDKNTAKEGGDIGYFGKRQFVPSFEETAFGLKEIGNVSEIVETPLGYHIIKLTGKKQLKPRKFEDEAVENEIKQILQKEKLDTWLKFLTDSNKIEINNTLITESPSQKEKKDEN